MGCIAFLERRWGWFEGGEVRVGKRGVTRGWGVRDFVLEGEVRKGMECGVNAKNGKRGRDRARTQTVFGVCGCGEVGGGGGLLDDIRKEQGVEETESDRQPVRV